jgi:hypothetical protein
MEPLIPIALFFCAAAVLILRPVTARLGNLFDAMAHEKRAEPGESAELARVRNVLEHVSGRLDLLEERLDFTERLLSSGAESRGRTSAIPPADAGRGPVV